MKKYLFAILLGSCLHIFADNKTKCNQGNQSGSQGSGGTEQTAPNGSKAPNSTATIDVVRPIDPNEIIGPMGYDETTHWVSTEATLGYRINFENDPEFATAPAARVEVRLTLDEKADLYSFGLATFGFGEHVFAIADNPAIYQQRLDLRDEMGIYVDVVAGIDAQKREAFWFLSSIDPETNQPPLEVDKGFLPVNDKELHNGEGFVSFVMKADRSAASGDLLPAQASIVFDTNEAIETNVWENKLDAKAPTSGLTAAPLAEQPGVYQFRFSAQDDEKGAGVQQIHVYGSKNQGVYQEIALCTPDSLWNFTVEPGAQYAFFAQAEDYTGNLEALKEQPDFTLDQNRAPTDIQLSNTTFQDDIEVDGFIGELNSTDTEANQTFTYALVEGEGAIHNDLFRIEGNRLLAGTSFRCADETRYQVRIQTTDVGGLTYAKAFTLEMKQVLVRPELTTLDITICKGESYTLCGQTFTETGQYTCRKENLASCDSVYVLNLQVRPQPVQPTITVEGTTLVSSALEGNQWYSYTGAIEGATGQRFTPTESGDYYVVVSNGGCESAPSESYHVDLTGTSAVSWDWSAGWNWVSVNIQSMTDPIQFLRPVESAAERFVGQTSELTKDPVYGLTGGLTMLSPTTMYKLKLNAAQRMELEGESLSPADYTLTLNQGWNWLGYVPAVEQTPDEAFSQLHPIRNDQIKSQTDVACYDGSRWVGSLQKLVPGEGYLYYSNQQTTFQYPTAVGASLRMGMLRASSQRNEVWRFDPHKYANNMAVVAQVYDASGKAPEGIYTIGAFVGNECRGIGVYNQEYLFLVVHGDVQGSQVTFKAYENATGKECAVKETIRLQENSVGNLNAPYELHVTASPTGMETMDNLHLTVYPNPVHREAYIGGDYAQVKQVVILNLNGVVLMRLATEGANSVDLSSLPEGAYLMGLETEQGIVYKKILKTSK